MIIDKFKLFCFIATAIWLLAVVKTAPSLLVIAVQVAAVAAAAWWPPRERRRFPG